ncbi:signal peptidase I [Nocardioides sp.]|uniref:signal peptidase I n=1 Tax=Nocardioides sp. TaxID=35761 RepID=UPI0027338412|nr:signal peptidase I [Nocardioides sp.]MDP3890606.1 signal peptidase I [Nocardioides sp.]
MASRVWRIGSGLVIAAGLALLAVAIVVPRVGGATPYVVQTGSMRPDLPPGSLVVVRPVTGDDISVGDVVTYQVASGEPVFVTHRVVAVGYDGRGELSLRTQGDANDVPDQESVREVQVRGELWYAVPHIGHVSSLLTGSQRALGVYAVAAGLLLYALAQFVGALRGRRSRARHREPAHV